MNIEAFEYLMKTNACKYIRKKNSIICMKVFILFSLTLFGAIWITCKNINKFDIESFVLMAIFFIAIPLFVIIVGIYNTINLIRVKDPLYVKFATIYDVDAKGSDYMLMGPGMYKIVVKETIEFYVTCKEDNGKIHKSCLLAEKGLRCRNRREVKAREMEMQQNIEEFVGKNRNLYKGDRIIIFKFSAKEKGKYFLPNKLYFVKYEV